MVVDDAPEANIGSLSYEAALAELESLIRRLETGSVELADAIKAYERGVALASHCSQLLEHTEKKVHRLVLGPRGEPSEVPMDPEENP